MQSEGEGKEGRAKKCSKKKEGSSALADEESKRRRFEVLAKRPASSSSLLSPFSLPIGSSQPSLAMSSNLALPLEVIERILKFALGAYDPISSHSPPSPPAQTSQLLLLSRGLRELALPTWWRRITIVACQDWVALFGKGVGLLVYGEEGRKRWEMIEVLEVQTTKGSSSFDSYQLPWISIEPQSDYFDDFIIPEPSQPIDYPFRQCVVVLLRAQSHHPSSLLPSYLLPYLDHPARWVHPRVSRVDEKVPWRVRGGRKEFRAGLGGRE